MAIYRQFRKGNSLRRQVGCVYTKLNMTAKIVITHNHISLENHTNTDVYKQSALEGRLFYYHLLIWSVATHFSPDLNLPEQIQSLK